MLIRLFGNNNRYSGEVVDLKKERTLVSTDSVLFGIYEHETDRQVGECDLRLKSDLEYYYAGNIGYRIYEPYRGHSYAYYACRVLLGVARNQFGMKELIITCSPDNIPSRKTIEKLDAQFIECVNVPADHWLYRRGEKIKNIYKIIL